MLVAWLGRENRMSVLCLRQKAYFSLNKNEAGVEQLKQASSC